MLESTQTEPKTTNTTSPYIENNRISETSRKSKLVIASQLRVTLLNPLIFRGLTSE
jgi:hypothetical protein